MYIIGGTFQKENCIQMNDTKLVIFNKKFVNLTHEKSKWTSNWVKRILKINILKINRFIGMYFVFLKIST